MGLIYELIQLIYILTFNYKLALQKEFDVIDLINALILSLPAMFFLIGVISIIIIERIYHMCFDDIRFRRTKRR